MVKQRSSTGYEQVDKKWERVDDMPLTYSNSDSDGDNNLHCAALTSLLIAVLSSARSSICFGASFRLRVIKGIAKSKSTRALSDAMTPGFSFLLMAPQ